VAAGEGRLELTLVHGTEERSVEVTFAEAVA